MFRLYLLTMSLVFVVGVVCAIQASSTISLASGLLLLGIGAGGVTAGLMSRVDGN
jgi:hypothetical protein